jgi:hypothetical protein
MSINWNYAYVTSYEEQQLITESKFDSESKGFSEIVIEFLRTLDLLYLTRLIRQANKF